MFDSLIVKDLGKKSNNQFVFKDISLHAKNSDCIAVTGFNGSGKSTFLKILANVTEKSCGKINWVANNTEIIEDKLTRYIGFVSPYLNLYSEFTSIELIEIIQNFRGIKFDKEFAEFYLEKFNLVNRKNDLIGNFSSGMLQRVKFIIALIHNPIFLFLDEPNTNLDEIGVETYKDIIIKDSQNRITFIATNDKNHLVICNKIVSINDYK